MKKSICYLLLIVCVIMGNRISAQELKLWYDRPAKVWEEALPLGNSRLGAMVYGIPQREELQLNEETIWGGSPYRNDNPKAVQALPEARKLIFAGKTQRLINSFTQPSLLVHMECPSKLQVVSF